MEENRLCKVQALDSPVAEATPRPDEQHVHHRTYERRGNEELTDCIALCRDCHNRAQRWWDYVHNSLPAEKKAAEADDLFSGSA